MGKAFVYKITNPIGQVYIGSTLNFERRLNYYKNGNCKFQLKLYNSIFAYGYNNHKTEIVWEGDVSIRFLKEREFGLLYNVLDLELGLNSILPKYGELKEIRSKDMTEKISLSNIGKSLSIESRNRVSVNNARVKPSKETLLKCKEASQRAILQYDTNGDFIKEYPSTVDAANENGLKRTAIKNAVNGISKTCAGYVWKFKDGKSNISQHKKVCQFDLKTNVVISYYTSISHAAKSLGLDTKSIARVVNGKGYSAAGFGWKQVTN